MNLARRLFGMIVAGEAMSVPTVCLRMIHRLGILIAYIQKPCQHIWHDYCRYQNEIGG
jgi:hypothetical protein